MSPLINLYTSPALRLALIPTVTLFLLHSFFLCLFYIDFFGQGSFPPKTFIAFSNVLVLEIQFRVFKYSNKIISWSVM